ncbi:MAG: 30S ribosomal protein S3 [Chloroflexi bacterium RIFCSPLOWO2_12_FULL_71_12]|nr:MAG: 30S ribosomal protein S3 [Chloroflexi bacterium RIFCSPLOWO2_12_FULL_71_12]
MGQKTHPVGFRLGIIKQWNAKWYAGSKTYKDLVKEDVLIRRAIRGRLRDAAIARIEIERSTNQVTVTIHTAKPGVVIGKGGSKVEELRQLLGKTTKKTVKVNIFEIRYPEADANLIAESIAQQLERRVSFRKALKQSVQRAMRSGAKGVRVMVAGRLGGSEMSRREWEREGRVPLHTIRADLDFGRAIAKTTYGTIGVKAWIYKGDVAPAPRAVAANAPGAARPAAPAPAAPLAPAVPAPAAPVPTGGSPA